MGAPPDLWRPGPTLDAALVAAGVAAPFIAISRPDGQSLCVWDPLTRTLRSDTGASVYLGVSPGRGEKSSLGAGPSNVFGGHPVPDGYAWRWRGSGLQVITPSRGLWYAKSGHLEGEQGEVCLVWERQPPPGVIAWLVAAISDDAGDVSRAIARCS